MKALIRHELPRESKLQRGKTAISAMATATGATESLLAKDDATCCCGLRRDYRKWISWRGPGGDVGNRVPWQALCSVLMMLEMIP